MGGSPGGGAATATPGAAAVGRRRAALTTALMNLASIVERADEGILPAVGACQEVGPMRCLLRSVLVCMPP